MKNKIAKIFFLLATFLVLSDFVLASTPTVSNVSGTVATGQTLTVAGTNFVQEDKTNWMDLYADNGGYGPNFRATGTGTGAYGFEGASNLADKYCGAGFCNGTYDNVTKLMGAKSNKFHIEGVSTPAYGTHFDGVEDTFSLSKQSFYWRSYFRFHNTGNGTFPDENQKMFLASGEGGNNAFWQPEANASGPQGIYMVTVQNTGNVTGPTYSFPMTWDTWYEIEGYYNNPTSGINTGTVQLWMNGFYQGSRTIDGAVQNYFYYGVPTAWSTNAGFGMEVYFDNMAFSTSRVFPSSLVEISGDNGANWMAQNFVSVGTNAGLSETSATIIADLPTKIAANYLLRITNNQQQTSPTFVLGVTLDNTAPTAPSWLGIM